MLHRTIPSLLFLLFCCQFASAQSDYLTLTGKVLDKQTKKAVPFAHVGIPEKGIGTTTGFDGGFEFKLPIQFQNSQLMVSCMGYDTYSKPVNGFKNGTVIYLDGGVKQLNEVVVMDKHAIKNIIRQAVKNIPKNYPDHASNMLGFYRESFTDDSLRYKYLAEGVLKIYKTSYKNDKEGQIGLVQGRKINLQNPLDTTFNSGFASGHMAAHRFDFVKNREDFLDEAYFPFYNYWIENVTTYNGRTVYIIGFAKDTEPVAEGSKGKKKKRSLADRLTGKKDKSESSEGNLSARLKGRIFIEKESLAFVRAEFEVTKEGLQILGDYPLYVGTWKANKYVVNYRMQDGKWYLSDALREGVRKNGSVYANEVKITEIMSERDNQIPYLERLERGNEFVQLTGRYDEDFWKNYNTTPMSEGLTEGVAQYKNMLKAQEAFSQANLDAIKRQRDSIENAELQRKKEELAKNKEITQEQLEDVDYVPESLRKMDNVRKKFRKTKFSLGTGVHLLSTSSDPIRIEYFDKKGESILALTDDISQRDFEVIARWEFDIFFHKNVFMRFGSALDFWDSFYKDWSMGAGLQMNLSKQRPVYLRTVAQYSYFRYFRKVGNAENDYGKFRVDRERFKGDEVRLSYGSRQHNLNLTGELAIELNRNRELYFRGTYHYTFARQQGVWFKETKQFGRHDQRIPVGDSRLSVTQNDQAFKSAITPNETFSFTVGLLFK